MGDVRGSGLAWAPGNAEALAAATSLAGDTFGVADRGWIAEGHLADLVLVRGELEEDVSRSHDIVAIWKDGTTNQISGGFSSASMAVRDGALVVTGEIVPAVAFPGRA